MDPRMLAAKCKQILGYEEVLDLIVAELEKRDAERPNNGTTAFLIAKQVLEQRGYRRGMQDFIGRIKHHAGRS